jgi:hypothetical protein
MALIDAALDLARSGYRVFPLEANGKRPIIAAWPAKATTDEQQVREWWSKWPDSNIGLRTGDGLMVLDCDTKGRPGIESLNLLDMLGLPDSYRVRTPSGGVHVYLKVTKHIPNTVDALEGFPGIDVRCDGGYVVAPGSVIDGTPYRALD